MSDNFVPTFDVEEALAFARERRARGLTEEQRVAWTDSLKELRIEIPQQIARGNFSNATLRSICYI